jgi:Putative bacterial sensory transduction regulator
LRKTLEACIGNWYSDPESSVEYVEEVDGRWAVRMRQETRDASTVWFEVGERSLRFEVYVLPLPEGASDAYRQALLRNSRSWRAFFALDEENNLVIRGRLSEQEVTPLELDLALGETYEMIEVAFRPLLRVAYPSRENSG